MKRLLGIFLLIGATGCTMPITSATVSSPNDEDILDKAKYDPATVCELHGVSLQIGYAPIQYGLPVGWQDYQNIRKSRFPHAADPVNEGCGTLSQNTARVKFCYQCQSAYQIRKRTEELNNPK